MSRTFSALYFLPRSTFCQGSWLYVCVFLCVCVCISQQMPTGGPLSTQIYSITFVNLFPVFETNIHNSHGCCLIEKRFWFISFSLCLTSWLRYAWRGCGVNKTQNRANKKGTLGNINAKKKTIELVFVWQNWISHRIKSCRIVCEDLPIILEVF